MPAAHVAAETLVNGRTFLVARPTGEIGAPGDGAVFEDLRFLSVLEIEIVDEVGAQLRQRLLKTARPNPFSLVAVSELMADDADRTTGSDLLVHRVRIGRGTHHCVEVRNLTDKPTVRVVRLRIDADFSHLFDVKAGKPRQTSNGIQLTDAGLFVGSPDAKVELRTLPIADRIDSTHLEWTVELPPSSQATIELATEPTFADQAAGALFPLGSSGVTPLRTSPAAKPQLLTTNGSAAQAFDQAVEDLASLRITNPTDPESVVVAAGAPWFMTLFGRDSLLTSWMTLPFAPDLAVGVLRALAALQGDQDNPVTEENPGKIIHELRRSNGSASFADRGRYYGSVDSTPLFVMLAHETWRWGHLSPQDLDELWPAISAATNWVRRAMTQSANGFLTYQRSTETGLDNQGWKDSWDGVTGADGKPASGPIALVEVQGYAYAALRAAADLAQAVERPGLDAAALNSEAERLRDSFNSQFWSTELDSFVLGLDGNNNQIASVTTNPGHAIWAGIADDQLANIYLDRCTESQLFTGWGLRTLSSEAAAYNPLSYHNGSVWPHDTALVAAGAARVGRTDVADQLAQAAFSTAEGFDGRPPELFAGFDHLDIPSPVPYPSSCSPQAWSSASIFLHLRSLLGMDVADGKPVIAREWTEFQQLRGVRVADHDFTLGRES